MGGDGVDCRPFRSSCFCAGFFGYLNVYFLQWVASRTIADLRVRLFGHLLNLSAGFYNENASGQLISRVINDTGALQIILNNATSVIVRDPVTLVGVLAFLLWQQPKLTLITMVFLPVCIIPIVIFSRKIRRSSRELQTQSAELTQTMTEAFTGHRIVKAYNLEPIVAGAISKRRPPVCQPLHAHRARQQHSRPAH